MFKDCPVVVSVLYLYPVVHSVIAVINPFKLSE